MNREYIIGSDRIHSKFGISLPLSVMAANTHFTRIEFDRREANYLLEWDAAYDRFYRDTAYRKAVLADDHLRKKYISELGLVRRRREWAA